MSAHILVVGAGPAGMSAAIEAQRRGCDVTVADEAPRPGGQIYRQSAGTLSPGIGLPAERTRKLKLIRTFESILSHINYRANTTVFAAFEGPVAHLAHVTESETLHPDAIIIATGVSERAVPFPGWTLPVLCTPVARRL